MDKTELDVFLGSLSRGCTKSPRFRIKWPEAQPDEEWLTLNGWKRDLEKATRVFYSPCGKFVCKRGYFTTTRIPSRAIPTRFLEPIGWCSWSFVLQPKADRGKKARKTWSKMKLDPRCDYDSHNGNIGIWNGKVVFIDW